MPDRTFFAFGVNVMYPLLNLFIDLRDAGFTIAPPVVRAPFGGARHVTYPADIRRVELTMFVTERREVWSEVRERMRAEGLRSAFLREACAFARGSTEEFLALTPLLVAGEIVENDARGIDEPRSSVPMFGAGGDARQLILEPFGDVRDASSYLCAKI